MVAQNPQVELNFKVRATDEASAVFDRVRQNAAKAAGQTTEAISTRAAQDSAKRVAEIESRTLETSLRAKGKYYEADLEALKRNLAQENDEVEKSLQQRLRMIEQARLSGAYGIDDAKSAEAAKNDIGSAQYEAARQRAANEGLFAAREEEAKRREEDRPARKKDDEEGSVLESLKSQFGRGSEFKETLELIEGGGAVVGLSILTGQMKEFTQHLLEVQKVMREGADAGEIAVKLGESIPILGSLVSAGQNIRELLTGEQAQIDEINESVARQNQLFNVGTESLRIRQDIENETQKRQRETAVALQTVAVEGSGSAFATRTSEIGLHQQQLAAINSGNWEQAPENQDLREKIDALRKNADIESLRKASEEADKKAEAAEKNQALIGGGQGTVVGFTGNVDDIKKAAAEARAQLDKATRELTSAEKQTIAAAGADASAQLKVDLAQQAQALREYDRERQDETIQTNLLISRAQSEANAQDLRNRGRYYQADLLLLNQSLAEKQAQIEKDRLDRIKQINGDVGAGYISAYQGDIQIGHANVNADAQNSAAQKQFDTGTSAAQLESARQLFQIQQSIAQVQLQGYGDAALARRQGVDAAKDELQIATEFAGRREQINELLYTANDQQKAILQTQLQLLPALQAEAETRAKIAREIEDAQHAMEIRKLGESILQGEIAAGAKGLQIDQQRLAIADSFIERREKIKQLLESATPAEAKQLQTELKALSPQAEAQAQRERINLTLRDQAKSALQSLADPDNAAARRALAQENITEQYNEQRQKLNELLKDPTASAQQKAAAQQILGGLDSTERNALRSARFEGIEFDPFARTQVNQGGLHGIAGHAQEQAFLTQHKQDSEAAKQTAKLDQLVKQIDKLIDAVQTQGDIQPVFN